MMYTDDVIKNTYLPLSYLLQHIELRHFHIQYVDVEVVLEMINMKSKVLEMRPDRRLPSHPHCHSFTR